MKRVLIVDDELVVLDVLERILSHLGYETVAVDSGESAMVRFKEQIFDIVFMDVLLPKKNGFEIAQEMKHLRKDQKIIMLTGLGPFANRYIPESESSEINDILPKPFTFNKVKDIVEEVDKSSRVIEASDAISSIW